MAFWRGDWFSILTPAYNARWFGTVVDYFSSFHVYTFTLISGFIYCHVRYCRGGYKSFYGFIKKKAQRLLIPYVSIALCWVIPCYIVFYHPDPKSVLINYGLGVSPSQLWFLLMLFDVFVASWLLSDFYYKSNLSVILPLVCYGIAIVGNSLLPNVLSIWNACRHMIMFWIGFKFYQYGLLSKIKGLERRALFLSHLILFSALQLFVGRSSMVCLLVGKGIEMLVRITGTVMAFTILQFFASKIEWKKNKLFTEFGKKSMPVYLLHQIIYVMIWFLNGKVNPYMNVLINFLVATSGAYLIGTLLMRTKVTRVLIGEK